MIKAIAKALLPEGIQQYLRNHVNPQVGLYNERNRVNWIKGILNDMPENYRILDAGAGEQKYKAFCQHLNYVSQDFAQYNGLGDGVGLQVGSWNQSNLDIVCDITSIPEENESFDIIMCIEVFEHLPEPILAIKEFSRLLKQNGRLIITAPFSSLTHFAPFHFYSGFNKYFYEYNLAQYGFEIKDIEANGNYFEYLAQELWRMDSIANKYTNNYIPNQNNKQITKMLKALKKYSLADIGSSELLCYGYNVLAVKK